MYSPPEMRQITCGDNLASQQMRVPINLDVTQNRLLSAMPAPVNGDILHLDHRNLPQRLSKCFKRFTLKMLMHGVPPLPAREQECNLVRQLKGGLNRRMKIPQHPSDPNGNPRKILSHSNGFHARERIFFKNFRPKSKDTLPGGSHCQLHLLSITHPVNHFEIQ